MLLCSHSVSTLEDTSSSQVLSSNVLATVFALAVCVELGDLFNRFLVSKGMLLPGFLTAMFTGIVITNSVERVGLRMNRPAVDLCSEVSLQLFLSMSLMSIQLASLAGAMGPILLILIVQVTVMAVFAAFVVFRVMGRDYDACVISAGFVGLGLGATPVGIANMSAITTKYRPSPKAFLVIPLVGAFFIDIVNVLVIKMFAASELIRGAPL